MRGYKAFHRGECGFVELISFPTAGASLALIHLERAWIV
jgi:hypothetical protein